DADRLVGQRLGPAPAGQQARGGGREQGASGNVHDGEDTAFAAGHARAHALSCSRMTARPDRLVRLANHPWARQLLRDMGVPQPRVLRRVTTASAQDDLQGRRAGVVALPGGFAQASCRAWLAAAGAVLADAGEIDTLVADATGCRRFEDLRALRDALQEPVRRLAEHGRLVL